MQSKRESWKSIRQLGADVVCVVRKALWAPVAVLVFHEVAAFTFGHEPHVDIIAHFTGGIASAFFIRHSAVIGRRYLGEMTALGLGLLAFGLTCVVALLWELAELSSDIYLGTFIQRSARNTLRDLALAALGAMLFLIVSQILRVRQPTA